MSDKPNCYECKHRRDVPGNAHSRCVHPSIVEITADPLNELLAIFAGVGRVGPVVHQKAADTLDIHGNFHGIRNGWFNWPYNFDPVWLKTCKGFTAIEQKASEKASKP